MSRLVRTFTSLMFVAACVAVAAAGTGEKEKAALTAAEKWLAIVDEGKYSASWREAAGYFRNAVTRAQWEQSMEAYRRPLGRLLSRRVKSEVYGTSLPGAPDGEYVVIQFQSSFENKKQAVETVTPMRDSDREWRVSGYYIK